MTDMEHIPEVDEPLVINCGPTELYLTTGGVLPVHAALNVVPTADYTGPSHVTKYSLCDLPVSVSDDVSIVLEMDRPPSFPAHLAADPMFDIPEYFESRRALFCWLEVMDAVLVVSQVWAKALPHRRVVTPDAHVSIGGSGPQVVVGGWTAYA